MKAINKFVLHSYDIIKTIAGALMIVIIIIVTLGITSRYFLGNALPWTEELCCLFLVWLCYLSASLTTVKKEHVVADFFVGLLPQKGKRILSIIIRLSEIFFFIVIAYSVIKLLPHLTNLSAALKMPRYVYYLPVLIFSAYMAFVVLVDVLNEFIPGYDYFWQRQRKLDEEADKAQEAENDAMLKRADEFLDNSEGGTKR